MNVTVVADVLGEENNGTTVAAMNLIRYLQKRGDNVRILCSDQNHKGEENYFVVPVLNLGPLNVVLKKNEVALSKPVESIIREALQGADVVHVILPFALGTASMKIACEMGIPVTAGFHCQAENLTSHIALINVGLANRTFYRYIYRHFYRYVDFIHYPTQFIRDTFEKVIRHETPGVVVSNGVNEIFKKQPSERPPEYDGKFVILFIGRLSREKSHNLLLEGVQKSSHRDQIRLILAGAGPLQKRVEKYAKHLGIVAPHIEFYSRKELVRVINYADLYCHPAEIEIEAISCLEAIRCGLVPVISDSPRSATKCFALDERNLFHYNDPEDLAKKIDFWIEHPELKEEYSQRYQGFTDCFDQSVCMEQTRGILVRAVEKKKEALLPAGQPECEVPPDAGGQRSEELLYASGRANDTLPFVGDLGTEEAFDEEVFNDAEVLSRLARG